MSKYSMGRRVPVNNSANHCANQRACPCAAPIYPQSAVDGVASFLLTRNPAWTFARAQQRAYVELLKELP